MGLCLFLLLAGLMRSSAQEIIQGPESVSVMIDQSATFTCITSGGSSAWAVNNSLLESFEPDILEDIDEQPKNYSNGTTMLELSIRVRADYNGTTVQCVLTNIDGDIIRVNQSAVLTTEEAVNITVAVPSSVLVLVPTTRLPMTILLSQPSPSLTGVPTTSSRDRNDAAVIIALSVVFPLLAIIVVVVVVVVTVIFCPAKPRRSPAGAPMGLIPQPHGIPAGAPMPMGLIPQPYGIHAGAPMGLIPHTTEPAYIGVHIEGIPTVGSVMTLLRSEADRWGEIADTLHVDSDLITGTDEECLKEVLKVWVSQNPSWSKLYSALNEISITPKLHVRLLETSSG